MSQDNTILVALVGACALVLGAIIGVIGTIIKFKLDASKDKSDKKIEKIEEIHKRFGEYSTAQLAILMDLLRSVQNEATPEIIEASATTKAIFNKYDKNLRQLIIKGNQFSHELKLHKWNAQAETLNEIITIFCFPNENGSLTLSPPALVDAVKRLEIVRDKFDKQMAKIYPA